MERKYWYLLGLVAIIVICVVPFIVNPDAEFGGADDAAGELVEDTGYEPWFESIIGDLPSETESMLFALQAAIGALIIGFVLGRISKKSPTEKSERASVKTDD
ncbi:energy-coupling factor ABC transporter substrate-binding protein [Candidatus Methanomassiliicoccus intestinalis]|uniref:energy-coupling factor ABC transporter substrate-binding protein n=1 Tax=Candidatus Methanomassiliicoccus intestinalis TaxID=1406512 RepID=UPI0037DD9BBE